MTNVTLHEDVTDLETANDTDLLPEIEVATLNSGDYFGECALLRVISKSVLWTELLGPFETVRENFTRYFSQ